jgi:DDE superfamily endonuclease
MHQPRSLGAVVGAPASAANDLQLASGMAIANLELALGHRADVEDAVGDISLLFLPPYRPELNPVEELWHELRRRFFANRVIDTVEELIAACCTA